MVMENKAIILCEKIDGNYAEIQNVLSDFGMKLNKTSKIKLLLKFIVNNSNGLVIIEKKYKKYFYFMKSIVNDFNCFDDFCFVFLNNNNLNQNSNNVFLLDVKNINDGFNKIIKESGLDLTIKNIYNENDIKQKINNMLIQLGFLPKYTGFKYIADGLNYIVVNKSNCKNYCKEIYDYLIKEYNINMGSIERNIKSVTNNAMSNGGLMFELFGQLNKKATNRTVISFLVEYLLTMVSSDMSCFSNSDTN